MCRISRISLLPTTGREMIWLRNEDLIQLIEAVIRLLASPRV